MAFLNVFMLFGAAALAVPIIIHILNRKSAKKVMWGAMRFLRDSLVNRRRKILLEEILLLVARCLLIALLVLAVARPFIAPGSQFSWLILLPLLLLAIATFAATFVLWQYPKARRRLFALALLLLAATTAALLAEERLQARIFGTRGARDIALIIDASDSMTMQIDGESNFERAIVEAENIIRAAPPGSAFSLIVGGSMPYAPVANPLGNREELLAALALIEPEKGLMRVPETMALAAFTLAQGSHSGKQIIVVSDGQREGWDIAEQPGQWQAVRESFEQLPSQPPVILRRLEIPPTLRNAAISGISLSRRTIGLDRAVVIEVTVVNHGSEAITPSGVDLTVEGSSYREEAIGQIPPEGTRTVSFEHRFSTPGAHVVEAVLAVDDDLPVDNRAWRVVTPISQLQVLIVDGNPSPRVFERASTFPALALAPSSRLRRQLAASESSAEPAEDFDQLLVRPRIVDAPDFAAVDNLQPYAAIILADVPRLSRAAAQRLAEYTADGGALLIALGPRAQAEFYNQWQWGMQPLLPAQLLALTTPASDDPEAAVKPDPASFSHPAINRFRDEPADLSQVVMRAYWRLRPGETGQEEAQPRIGARLSNRDPLLLDRSLGRGRVMLLATSLDTRGGNLPTSRVFVPLLHQLIYDLADSDRGDLNLGYRPGAALSLNDLAAAIDRERPAPDFGLAEPPRFLAVVDRDGRPGRGRLRTVEQDHGSVLRFEPPPNLPPGVHRIQIPDSLRVHFSPWLEDGEGLPFALLRQGNEGRLRPLTERDAGRLRQYLLWQETSSSEQLLAAFHGARFGSELWRPLATAAFLLLVAEIAIARWVALRRRTGTQLKVEFQERGQPRESFQEQLNNMRKPSKA